MRILGIDPGLRLTGYGVIDVVNHVPRLVDGGVIRLDARQPLASRLVELERELDALCGEHRPDICAVEMLYSHYAHPRTAILMGHARGVVLVVAARRGIRVEEFAANRIKQSMVGHGHAGKVQMQRAVQALWKLAEPPEPPDVADALAVAVCCGRALQASAVKPRKGGVGASMSASRVPARRTGHKRNASLQPPASGKTLVEPARHGCLGLTDTKL